MTNYKLEKIVIEWNEGCVRFEGATFFNWKDYQATLAIINKPDLGYNKVKTQFWIVDDEDPAVCRIDVGPHEGDFDPTRDEIKSYVNGLLAQGEAMDF